jgi:hypothetical protein
VNPGNNSWARHFRWEASAIWHRELQVAFDKPVQEFRASAGLSYLTPKTSTPKLRE